LVLVVDVANVMGSRPDGWWRDRAGAASRLLASLVPLVGATVPLPGTGSAPSERGEQDGAAISIHRVIAVVEGQARAATAPAELDVMSAPADGDTTIVAAAEGVLAAGHIPLVVTADRGLRLRLPTGSRIVGPRWVLDLL
jgi:hypothetical protein